MWELVWKGKLLFHRTKCFFVGHNERRGNVLNYEADYCEWCFAEWPQDKFTLPDLPSLLYGWLAERDWRGFERLDNWLYRHFGAWPR